MDPSTRTREYVAWDIETTGFEWDDTITTAAFWWPAGHADLILNKGGITTDAMAYQASLTETARVPVRVTCVSDEKVLLKAMGELLFERFGRDYNRLIAFNAESWRGGFDLPFVRTRCVAHGVDWVFDGVPFADLLSALKKRLNTTEIEDDAPESENSLSGAHAILFAQPGVSEALIDTTEQDHPWYRNYRYDPFETSEQAVTSYADGDHLPVLQHNLADVHRTWELGEIIREFVPNKDLSRKKL
jgi:hypothetical protein